MCELAQSQRLLITRDGQPFALIVGVEHKDDEDLQRETSPAFWKMIEERRGHSTAVSLDDFMAELEAEEKQCSSEGAGTTAQQ
jgi:hypothetical protein